MRRRLNIGYLDVLLVLIILAPFFFYAYNWFPAVKTVKFFGFGFQFEVLGDLETTAWYFANRFLTLLLVSIWYLTCRNSWCQFILILVIHEIRHIVLTTQEILIESGIIDSFNLYSDLLLVAFVSILFINWLWTLRLKTQKEYNDTLGIYNEIDLEILKEMHHVSSFKVRDYKLFRSNLNLLRTKKNSLDLRTYLQLLVKLKEDYLAINNNTDHS